MKKTIWIITGVSESTDHFGPDVFDHKPSKEEISEWCHNCDGKGTHWDDDLSSYEDGPGFDGSYVYPEVNEREIKV